MPLLIHLSLLSWRVYKPLMVEVKTWPTPNAPCSPEGSPVDSPPLWKDKANWDRLRNLHTPSLSSPNCIHLWAMAALILIDLPNGNSAPWHAWKGCNWKWEFKRNIGCMHMLKLVRITLSCRCDVHTRMDWCVPYSRQFTPMNSVIITSKF